MPEETQIGPAKFDLMNSIRGYLSKSQPGRSFQSVADLVGSLPEFLQPELGNMNVAGDLIPFSAFAKKSLDTEQGLTKLGQLSSKFQNLVGENIKLMDSPTTYARKLAIINPDNAGNSELVNAAKEYINHLDSQYVLRDLNLPHELEFFKPDAEALKKSKDTKIMQSILNPQKAKILPFKGK